MPVGFLSFHNFAFGTYGWLNWCYFWPFSVFFVDFLCAPGQVLGACLSSNGLEVFMVTRLAGENHISITFKTLNMLRGPHNHWAVLGDPCFVKPLALNWREGDVLYLANCCKLEGIQLT